METGAWSVMDKKQKNNMWIGGMFGWLAVTIGLRLSTRSNSIVVGMALLAFLIIMIKDRKGLASVDIGGRVCLLAGGALGLSVMTGILQGVPLSVWCLSALSLFGIGTILISWGDHLKDPEKVKMKVVYITAAFWIVVLIWWSILFMSL